MNIIIAQLGGHCTADMASRCITICPASLSMTETKGWYYCAMVTSSFMHYIFFNKLPTVYLQGQNEQNCGQKVEHSFMPLKMLTFTFSSWFTHFLCNYLELQLNASSFSQTFPPQKIEFIIIKLYICIHTLNKNNLHSSPLSNIYHVINCLPFFYVPCKSNLFRNCR